MITSTQSVELLAPAGGFDHLVYAIKHGADAVYMGGSRFGMRARADNFDRSEMQRAVDYAHEHNTRVYITVNTLMHSRDFSGLEPYLVELGEIGVDSVIMSDLGAMRVAREVIPHVDLHVSTQFSCTNEHTAWALYELGASRVVLARELSMQEIRKIAQNKPKDLELEAFVHGAMCMAYSGRCLISNHIKRGRDANKGACLQSCRWKYALVEEREPNRFFPIEEDDRGTYIMNAEDLNMLDHIHELVDAGVHSLKIEGRVKGPFYVATAVNAYRAVLDGADPALFQEELLALSHRPYGTGFYFGEASQTTESNSYSQESILVARVIDVASYDPNDPSQLSGKDDEVRAPQPPKLEHYGVEQECPLYLVTVRLENRFYPGDVLEPIVPFKPTPEIIVDGLQWYGYDFSLLDPKDVPRRLKDVPEWMAHEFVPVAEASRTADTYRFVTDYPDLSAGDLLRRRESRHYHRMRGVLSHDDE